MILIYTSTAEIVAGDSHYAACQKDEVKQKQKKMERAKESDLADLCGLGLSLLLFLLLFAIVAVHCVGGSLLA
jgi:hypothetical protein